MSRKVKCPECGTYNDKENTVYYNSKYYCKVCYDNKKRESQEYKELIAYICKLYQIDAPTGWMLKQIKEFKEQFNYTYRGIKSTLHYFYEIEGNEVADNIGIGIVPFVYEEAKKFYIDKIAVRNSINGCDLDELQNNKRFIKKIKPNRLNENKYKDMVLINIEELWKEEYILEEEQIGKLC